LLREDVRRCLAVAVAAMRAVLRAVLVFRLARRQRLEELEDGFRPFEALAVAVREQRDLVLALAVLLPRRNLFRDEVEAELRQPLANGRRIRAPLGLVEREHRGMFDGARAL
jgi:hypothetical protein